jgi:hypothetical protein
VDCPAELAGAFMGYASASLLEEVDQPLENVPDANTI